MEGTPEYVEIISQTTQYTASNYEHLLEDGQRPQCFIIKHWKFLVLVALTFTFFFAVAAVIIMIPTPGYSRNSEDDHERDRRSIQIALEFQGENIHDKFEKKIDVIMMTTKHITESEISTIGPTWNFSNIIVSPLVTPATRGMASINSFKIDVRNKTESSTI